MRLGSLESGELVPLYQMCIGRHKFPGLDGVMVAPKGALNLSSVKTVLRGEAPHPTRGDPFDAEEYGSRVEGR